jgi:hypothetical protein
MSTLKRVALCVAALSALLCGGLERKVEAAPAPPLTAVRIGAVWTPAQGIEYIPLAAMSTVRDHGGNRLEFATVETGYGRTVSATFNGLRATEFENQPILARDRSVIGWIRYWRVNTNVRSGRIEYSSDSIVYPYRRQSTSLWVR